MFFYILFLDIIWLYIKVIDYIFFFVDIWINELKLWLFIYILNKWMGILYFKWRGNIIRDVCMLRKFRISENE